MKRQITINPKTCVKVAERGRADIEAFLFVCQLRSIVKHPILLNFKANLTAYRLLLGLTDLRYRKNLNNAVRLGYARIEGNHLRLLSKSQERKQFNSKQRNNLEVQQSQLTQVFNLLVLQKNIKSQNGKVKSNAKTALTNMAQCSGVDAYTKYCNQPVNHDITMSVRKCASLLHVSISTANNILARLKGRGLSITNNVINITKSEFRELLAAGCKGVRYKDGTYQLIKARHISINLARYKANYTKNSMGYCADI